MSKSMAALSERNYRRRARLYIGNRALKVCIFYVSAICQRSGSHSCTPADPDKCGSGRHWAAITRAHGTWLVEISRYCLRRQLVGNKVVCWAFPGGMYKGERERGVPLGGYTAAEITGLGWHGAQGFLMAYGNQDNSNMAENLNQRPEIPAFVQGGRWKLFIPPLSASKATTSHAQLVINKMYCPCMVTNSPLRQNQKVISCQKWL